MSSDKSNQINILMNNNIKKYFDDNDLELTMLKVKLNSLFDKTIPVELREDKTIISISNSANVKKLLQPDKTINSNRQTPDFISTPPEWSLEQIVLPKSTKKEIDKAFLIIQHTELIFEKWNLKSVMPNARSALNFYGPPGTGKTMCAHAIAEKLGKRIMCLNYAQIESKFVGEAPKNLEAAFDQSEKNDSVLFFDEADSLLGRRISGVSTGSEQAINSLRSQMLIAIEKFSGIVIFASNFIENYDKAFESRIKSIHFDLPDYKARYAIWNKHIPKELPIELNLDIEYLAKKFKNFSGRDIRNAILGAVTDTLSEGNQVVGQKNLITSCKNIRDTRFLKKDDNKQKSKLKKRIRTKLKKIKNKERESITIQLLKMFLAFY